MRFSVVCVTCVCSFTCYTRMTKHPEPMPKFVAYYRVSTVGQEASGLGEEAQRMAVRAHLATHPEAELVAEFREVESGRKKNRPELAKAVRICKRDKATLVIAKLDRLARNVHFVSGLMESGVDFVACDNPHANKLMVHMLAAFAEHEREMISQRTKDGLRAAKARGVVLGATGKVRAEANRASADERALEIWPQVLNAIYCVRDGTAFGRLDIFALTRELNARNVPTAKGGHWHRQSVYRLLRRYSDLGLEL